MWPKNAGLFIRRSPEHDVGDEAVPGREELTGRRGLISALTKADGTDKSPKLSTFNARSETALKSFTFGDASRKAQRCIIPAEAFYEPDGNRERQCLLASLRLTASFWALPATLRRFAGSNNCSTGLNSSTSDSIALANAAITADNKVSFSLPESRRMNTLAAHCNTCMGVKDHSELHCERTSWEDRDQGVSGSDSYQTLQCLGCKSVGFRHTQWFSEDDPHDEPQRTYYPAAIHRARAAWYDDLCIQLPNNEAFVGTLLGEIYRALQHDLLTLALTGLRSLNEQIMITKSGDHRSFVKNMDAFAKLGHVSTTQRKRLEAILEAGHATVHRGFEPSMADVITALDITEHIIESVYLHDAPVAALAKRIPQRAARPPRS